MKILFVSRSLPFHHVGGMESVVWDLARELARMGHHVEILTTACEALLEDCEKEGVSIRVMQVTSGRYSTDYWRVTRSLYKQNYKTSVDAIISVGMGAYSIVRDRGSGPRPVLIMQSHGQAWGELKSKLAVRSASSILKSPKNLIDLARDRSLRYFDSIVAVGPAVSAVLNTAPTKWLLGKTPTTTIPNGIDTRCFAFNVQGRKHLRASLKVSDEAFVITSASRLHAQKGLREAIEGFSVALRQLPEAHYVIAGDGPAEGAIQAQIKKLGLQDSVHLVGAINREDLPAILSGADAFLFTSKRIEGFALGPLEASSVGLPCILSSHLSIKGLNAMLVDPDDAYEIGSAIIRSYWNKQTHGSRSELPPVYSLRHTAAKYAHLLASLKEGLTFTE